MASLDLRAFIDSLDQQGELLRITAEVDPELEIAEIADRAVKSGGPALFFEKVKGSSIPVAINLFAGERRMARALGVEHLDELSDRIGKLLALTKGPPGSWRERFEMLGEGAALIRFKPKTVSNAPCQEIVKTGDEVDLAELPIIKCWPEDGGRYVTLPLVVTNNPRTGKRNVGMYRIQVYDRNTAGMHWHLHKDGAEHLREGERLPVAVAIGADPISIYAASAPLPPNMDELLFSGFMAGKSVRLVKCKTIDQYVPADAEIVLECYVDPAETRLEGPFGDHTGYYSLADEYPVFHVTAITHRRDPIYATTIVGRPPMEDAYLGKATERIFLPILQLVQPEIVDMNMPPEGGFHNLVIVSIKKRYPGHARKVMHAVWGTGLLMLSKTVVIVDDFVNVQDLAEVAWRLTNNLDPERDIEIAHGPLDALDHASPTPLYGSKLGIDATQKGPEDGYTRQWPPDIEMSAEIKALVDRRWQEYGFK